MPVFRSLRSVSHSAVLVPAAALCLALLGWVRSDVQRGRDIPARFTHAAGTASATPCVNAGLQPVGNSGAVRIDVRDRDFLLPFVDTTALHPTRGTGWLLQACAPRQINPTRTPLR